MFEDTLDSARKYHKDCVEVRDLLISTLQHLEQAHSFDLHKVIPVATHHWWLSHKEAEREKAKREAIIARLKAEAASHGLTIEVRDE